MVEGEDELSIGYVAGAHGIRGALKIRLDNPDSEALAEGRRVTLRDDRGQPRLRAKVSRVGRQPGSDRWRLWLEGVDDRDAAEALRGLRLFVPRSELPDLPEDEYYLADAIGAAVVRRVGDQAQPLGEVVGVTSNGIQDLFEVRWQSPGRGAREWLLPALPEFVVHIEPGRLEVDLPEGFLPTELETPEDTDGGDRGD